MRHGGSAGPGRLALPTVCRGIASPPCSALPPRGPAAKRGRPPEGAGSRAPCRGPSPGSTPRGATP